MALPADSNVETIKKFMRNMDCVKPTVLFMLSQLIELACCDFNSSILFPGDGGRVSVFTALTTGLMDMYKDLSIRRKINPSAADSRNILAAAFSGLNHYTSAPIDPPNIDHEGNVPAVRALRADTLIVHTYLSARLTVRALEYCSTTNGAATVSSFVRTGTPISPDAHREMVEWVYSRAWNDAYEEVKKMGLIPLALMTVFVNSGCMEYPTLLDGLATKLEKLIYQ